MKYIIQFEDGVYKADWIGDPGRTTVKENAAVFEDRWSAQKALDDSIDEYPYRTWKSPLIIPHFEE
ncbi:hypothetical protein KAR91_70580 [Candidatus Pacearchaeota archaeon]|nr:hypothetical protein [Candidatus Pacearchaeota archaeon]